MSSLHASRTDRTRMVLNVQILRFLAAAAVVCYHARPGIVPASYMPAVPEWLHMIQVMGFAGVDVFFVISGAIMAMTTQSWNSGPRSTVRFGLRRLGRIYAGWWPFFVIYLVAFALMGRLGGKNLLASFWLWPASLPTQLLAITWTLSFELYFYLLLACLMLLPRAGRTWGVALLGVAVVVCSAVSWWAGLFTPAGVAESSVLQQILLQPLVAEFVAGYLLCLALHGGAARKPASRLECSAWLAGAAILGVAAGWYHLQVVVYPAGLAGYFYAPQRALLLGGMALCLVAWGLRAPPPRSRIGRALAGGGNASYSIYLAHILVLMLGYKFLSWAGWPNTGLAVVGGYVLVLAAAFGYSLLHYRFIELPLHRWIRRQVRRIG